MGDYKSISKWIDAMAVRGRHIFTKSELRAAFPDKSEEVAKTDLSRLLANGTIVSPWQNFYVIVPTEYKLKGIVPPEFYLDRLMKHLGCGRDVRCRPPAPTELHGFRGGQVPEVRN